MTKLFISYSYQDTALTERLVADLTARGFDVWWDQSAPFGEEWRREITVALEKADVAILLVTPSSLVSSAATFEWTQAIASSGRVLPVVALGADPSGLPMGLQHIAVINLDPDYETGVEAIVRSVAGTRVGPTLGGKRLRLIENISLELTNRLAGAKREIDLAANSLDGLLRLVPDFLRAAASRSVRTRVILPDPSYFSDVGAGRLLELSSRSRAALHQLSLLEEPKINVRLIRNVIPQTLLRIDNMVYIDPFPVFSRTQGMLAISAGKTTGGLYAHLVDEFEALFMESFKVPVPDIRKAASSTRDEFVRLIESGSGDDFERAVELYLGTIGFTPTARITGEKDAGYDFIAWEPQAGPTMVQAKQSARPIDAGTVEKTLQTAAAAGAGSVVLITNNKLTQATHELIENSAASYGVTLRVISTSEALEDLTRRSRTPE